MIPFLLRKESEGKAMKYYQNWFFAKREGQWYEQVVCTCYTTEQEARQAAEQVLADARRAGETVKYWKTQATK